MTTDELLKLEQAILEAEEYSMKFKNEFDNGTCNFDTPMVRVKATPKQMSGIEWKTERYGKRGKDGCSRYLIYTKLHGQGNRRTLMAQAVAEKLRELGYDASVYYQMD